MKIFELEHLSEKIHFVKTQENFVEVVKAYQNQCYRSSVVMLWSVVISDLVYKLQNLVDQYGDKAALQILTEIRKVQDDDPKSSAWELTLLDRVFSDTDFIDSSEYENLRYLQKQRHLSAHPVLRQNLELYKPNRETVRSLIRNSLEGVLIKPPFYTQKVITELIEDLDEAKVAINSFSKLKRYISSRYLNRLSQDVEMAIFRTFWKFVFRLTNEKCDANRQINSWVVRVITERHKERASAEVKSNSELYSKIASKGSPIEFLMFYLSCFPGVYSHLSEDAKLKILHARETTSAGKIYGWFVQGDLTKHFEYLYSWISSDDHPALSDKQWVNLLRLSDSEEWEECVSKLIVAYYCTCRNFDEADAVFTKVVQPYLNYFTKDSALLMLEEIEKNNQVWERRRATSDHPKLKGRFDELLGEGFDYEMYPRFFSSIK